jgi:cell wall-associated NlpC family hydrolase
VPTAGVSGLAIALTTAGGVLLTAAIRNQSPIDVIKVVLKRPTSGATLGNPYASATSGVAIAAGSLTSAGAAVGVAVASAVGGGALVAEARKHLGAKYVFGAVGPTTFDCSGFVVYCLRKTLIPNCKRFTTYTVSSYLSGLGWHKVTPAQFAAGDVIIRSGHMGIASSNTTYINAPHTGTVVKEVTIPDRSSFWGYRP